MRPHGLSAFVRCKNEEEYIVASLLSGYRVFDEILVALNNSNDKTRELIEDLIPDHPKIKILDYVNECSPIGPGYIEKVRENPTSSLAKYYNWCLDQTKFSHVCKWDGDMVAIPVFEAVRDCISTHDVVTFDGYDVLGQRTTDSEARVFRYNPTRARYVDWDMYEVLEHDYSRNQLLNEKCYLHMKLVKREWVHKQWVNPNDLATRSVPETGARNQTAMHLAKGLARKVKQAILTNS